MTSMQRTQHADPIDERIDFFFTCRSWTGEPRIVEPAKCAALDWFALDALPDPVVPHERCRSRAGWVRDWRATPRSASERDAPSPTARGRERTAMVTDLGEQPTPEIEPAEPPPGGVDAVEESQYDEPPLVPDLARVGNEHAKDEIPDAVTEPERDRPGARVDGDERAEKERRHERGTCVRRRPRAAHRAADSNPNAGGPTAPPAGWASAASASARPVAGESTDGERDTTEPRLTDQAGDLIGSDAEFARGTRRTPRASTRRPATRRRTRAARTRRT